MLKSYRINPITPVIKIKWRYSYLNVTKIFMALLTDDFSPQYLRKADRDKHNLRFLSNKYRNLPIACLSYYVYLLVETDIFENFY